MQFLPFAALYAGILLTVAFVCPVWSNLPGAAVAVDSIGQFPGCWHFVREDYLGEPYPSGPIMLERTHLEFPFDTAWYRARDTKWSIVSWAPAQGDSFDIHFYHDPTIRFPRGPGLVVGRVYYRSYPALIWALLQLPEVAMGEAIECPKELMEMPDPA
jgi:hypothetical protein